MINGTTRYVIQARPMESQDDLDWYDFSNGPGYLDRTLAEEKMPKHGNQGYTHQLVARTYTDKVVLIQNG
jgi:hypothetical protein